VGPIDGRRLLAEPGEGVSYQLLPSLSVAEYTALREDIRARGEVVVPVIQDEAGNVLDGYHRLRAVAELRAEGVSIPDPPVDVRAGLSEAQKVALIVGLNLSRRHLSEYQRVRLAAQLLPRLREEAEARRLRNLRHRQGGSSGNDVPARMGAVSGRARDLAAEIVGLGTGRTLDKHRTVIGWVEARAAEDPQAAELLQKAEAGKVDMRHLRRFVRSATAPERATQAQGEPADDTKEPTVRDLKALDPNIQGRTPWYRVALTARDFDAFSMWVYQSGDPDRIAAFRTATVSLLLAREEVIRYRDELAASGFPGLASCFAAALEADETDVADAGDLTSEERAVIRRIRQTDTGIVEVRVVRGTPKVPPLRHWRWGQGKSRRRREEGAR